MPRQISSLSEVHPDAVLGDNVFVGPFCLIGPDVAIGDGCQLLSHVAITGHTTIGARNKFHPGCVIGGEPQDLGYQGSSTRVHIGDDNIFREGVTVNRGADKEDGLTRLGNSNFLMANAHVAHNCHVHNNVILCNGSLLGGHVHVHDYAIISGNSVVHHFASIGTCAFLSGGCRCPTDLPPYMLAAGSDDPKVVTVNVVGMRRRGIADATIQAVREAFKLIYRECRKTVEVRDAFASRFGEDLPPELTNFLEFIENSERGKNGRAREVMRNAKPVAPLKLAETPDISDDSSETSSAERKAA